VYPLPGPSAIQYHPISGLSTRNDVITPTHHDELVRFINAQPWSSNIERRTQHYGARYDYDDKKLYPAPPMPPQIAVVADLLVALGIFRERPGQLIVAEYQPGQGIGAHTDHVSRFGETIVSLSLLGTRHMTFTRSAKTKKPQAEKKVKSSTTKKKKGRGIPFYDISQMPVTHSVPLVRRSLVILMGAARYLYKHAISANKTIKMCGIDGAVYVETRISLTFRELLEPIEPLLAD
jgi:alkylated DNA repair dioxygenase AlkB